jgi:hypothetical protein
MHRIFLRTGAVSIFALLLAGCDQAGLGPQQAVSAPAREPAPLAQPVADLRPHAGEHYPTFASNAGARYSPDELGFNATDRARLWRAMATTTPGQIVEGGGAQALVFRGCAETSCQDGAAVVAVDLASGLAFVAIHDAAGAEVLTPNDRVEALLRLNSPSRRWDDPAPTQTAAAETARP